MDDLYLNKVLSGDYNSFSYFVKTYKRFAFSVSFAILKDRNLAEDVVQDSFVKAFKQLKSFRRESKFQTWFGKIIINESLRAAKGVAFDFVSFDEMPEENAGILNDSLESLAAEEQKHYITAVFEHLSVNEALALELFYMREFTLEEMMQSTGWSESKTKMLLLRGRKSFYYNLKRLLKSEVREII